MQIIWNSPTTLEKNIRGERLTLFNFFNACYKTTFGA